MVEIMNKLPIIDLRKAELKEEWVSLREKVYKALKEYGCFEALFDGVPKERLYEKTKQVFHMPNLDTKFKEFQTSITSGYTKNEPITPHYEKMITNDILSPGVIQSLSNILWPDGDPEFCDLVHSYSKRLSELDEIVKRMVFEKLGIEKYWDEHRNSTSSALGFLHYKMPKAEETKVGVPPHTDKLITSILSQRQVGASGLQIKMKNGQWVDAEYSSPHSFIFLVSDILSALTNGRLPYPFHRVIIGNEERYSIGFTTTAKEGYIIKVAEELVDEDHPLLYKPFDAIKYLEFCLANPGNNLETYCGAV